MSSHMQPALHAESPYPSCPGCSKVGRMEANNIIEAVTEPTEWCAPMVLSEKSLEKHASVST